MIARHWRGWTTFENAAPYERLLREKVLPALHAIPGYAGGYILRQDHSTETEFVVLNFFESLDAVKAFAGENYSVPVFEPEARDLLSRIELTAAHYQVRESTLVSRMLPIQAEEGNMNWDTLEGKWKQLKGSVKKQWGKLTDDDLDYMSGSKDQFVGRLQERYGIAKDEAQRQADNWLRAQKETETTYSSGGGSSL
jgi:uncharacterized protein YjbJ (UPF0337 family)